jgi:hypothetical protein
MTYFEFIFLQQKCQNVKSSLLFYVTVFNNENIGKHRYIATQSKISVFFIIIKQVNSKSDFN